MQPLIQHVRENHSVLAAAERRFLIRIAGQLPARINSDHLTALALAAMIAGGAAFSTVRVSFWAAPVVVLALAVNWFGDSLDGTLARVRRRERPRYGYYVDHVIDLAGTAALMCGVAASGAMTPAVAFATLAAYCIVSAESYLATYSLGTFRLSVAGIGPTELRIVLAAGAVAVAIDPWVEIGTRHVLLLDLGGVIASAGMFAVFAGGAIRNGRVLYRMPECES
jgi:archaetidylinositol phosphate synthase